MPEDKVRLHAIIKGRVQGVGFRAFVYDQASRLPITGWVRNTYDGDVEVTAEGARSDLELLLEALHRGPRGSFVLKVIEDWTESSGEFSKFQIIMWG